MQKILIEIWIEIVTEIGRRGSTMQLVNSQGHVLRDWQWCKIDVRDQMFCLADKNNGRRWRWPTYECSCCTCCVCYDCLSNAARMYWLIHHAHHARDINMHKLHPLPEKNRLGPLCHSGTGYIENSRVHSMIDVLPISVRIFQNEHCSFWQETQLSLRDRATRACQLKSGKVLHKCRRLVFEKLWN